MTREELARTLAAHPRCGRDEVPDLDDSSTIGRLCGMMKRPWRIECAPHGGYAVTTPHGMFLGRDVGDAVAEALLAQWGRE